MISLAHIINPVVVDHTSDLIIAQPITFATMEIAKEFSQESVDVNLYAIQYDDEESVSLPQVFIRVPDLKRSIANIKAFTQKRKLPLIKDILEPLYEATNADYFIYTNVDISLQPYFYQTVSRIIEQGYDAFVINRRTIPDHYKDVDEIPLMYAELGEKHPGWDCFVFHKSLYPRFQLGTVCIGSGWFGRAMIINMAALAKKFEVFTELHITFHIGNNKAWQSPQFDDYLQHNKNECRKVLTEFDQKYGPFDRQELPGRFFSRL
jgi:hypothetical protein